MKKSVSNRIFELDFLRGLALVMMCLDHLVYDLSCLPYWFPLSDSPVLAALGNFGDAVSYSDWRLCLHYVFAPLFLVLAGIGSSLTRRPLKRCLQIAGGALVITLATVFLDLFFDLGVTILFGVLSAMAVGAFLCWICSLFGDKMGKYVALAAGITVIAVGFRIPWYHAPNLYAFGLEDLWGIAIGTVRYGSDWFPVFPSSGVMLVGYFLGKLLYRGKRSLIPALRGKSCFLCAVGRHSLGIYLFHQPVIVAVLYLFILIFVGD